MAAALTITPPSGQIQARLDAVHIRITGADVNNADGTQKRYRVRLTPPAGDESITWSGYSELFNVSADGKHEAFPGGYIFPADGSWTVRLYDEEEEEDVATLAVTVV
jgi:hypothetical protein